MVQRPFSLSAERISTWKKMECVYLLPVRMRGYDPQGPFQITSDSPPFVGFTRKRLHNIQRLRWRCIVKAMLPSCKMKTTKKFEQVYLRFETMTGIMVNPEIQPIATFEGATKDGVFCGRRNPFAEKEEYLSTEIPSKVPTAGAPPQEEIVDIVTDNIDSWEEGDKQVVVAIGNVKIKKWMRL